MSMYKCLVQLYNVLSDIYRVTHITNEIKNDMDQGRALNCPVKSYLEMLLSKRETDILVFYSLGFH